MEKRKTAIVTGAYGAIGKAIARQLAAKGFSTILAGRDEHKLASAVKEIIHQTGNPETGYAFVDLSSKLGIIKLAANWTGVLHVLVNNACTAPRLRTETPEGIETEFATNVLGYFWMTRYFSKFMTDPSHARIINVSSYWAGNLDLNDLEFKRRRYNNDEAYRQSKQADRMLAVAFADRLKKDGITVNSCHPGDVNSKLSNILGFGGSESPDHGAATPVWLATDPEVKDKTGKYFANKSEVYCEFSKDLKEIEALYEVCENY
jgi:NAD(P)-dependent dehydrogenase (short-subunit alcohol dehydrogenase family)